MRPYYDEDGITIYHGDCREVGVNRGDVMVTDPPYGVSHMSGWAGKFHDEGIHGDADTEVRDWAASRFVGPALVFGSWKIPYPTGTHTVLIWDKGPAAGMGDLSVPWKPNWEQIYVIGKGFSGRRDSGVLSGYEVVTWSTGRAARLHPTQKPVSLMIDLIGKCPDGVILDPFMGSGSTLRAAKDLGRKAIGIEIEERYCEIAAKRLAQGSFAFAAGPPDPKEPSE